MIEVSDSVENYTHEEILDAELKLIELENYLQPEKLKLETLDINLAKLLKQSEYMLKLILQDKFREVINRTEQEENYKEEDK